MYYFKNRVMRLKNTKQISAPRTQPGSGAQGATLGNQDFLSQTNLSANSVPVEDFFKYVDDLIVLEIINLLSVGISSYNFRKHIPTDVPCNGFLVDSKNLKTQNYLNQIKE